MRRGSGRIYRRLLSLYPRALRVEYGDDMVADLGRMVADARADGARFPTLRVWSRVLADLIVASIPGDVLRKTPRTWARRHGALSRRRSPMGVHLHDLRFALRILRRQPMFVLIASLTIAIGVSATATIFSAVNALLLRPPAGVHGTAELVTVHGIDSEGTSFHAFGIPYYRELAAAGALEELAAFDLFDGGLSVDDVVARTSATIVSGNYFQVLGTQPVMGRFFGPAEDVVPGQDPVAVISHRLWEQRFVAEPDIVGRQVVINGKDFTVVGVAEPGFHGHLAVFSADLWVPLSAQGLVLGATDLSEEKAHTGLELVGRLAPNQTAAQGRAALDAAGASFAEERGETWYGVDVLGYSPFFPAARQRLAAFLGALFVVAGVLLTITAVNVANMLLSRGAARSREIGIRLAMGATRSRLVAQLLTESTVLFALGGVFGVILTFWSTRLLATVSLPIPIEIDLDMRPDLSVLAFALAVAGITGLIFGLSPALHATRGDLVSALKESATRPGKKGRLRDALVLAQVAGTVVLLVAAGLLVRSLGQAGGAELGLEPQGVTVFFVDTGAAGRSAEESGRFFAEALEQTRQTPGIESASLIDVPPLALSNSQTRIVLPGRAAEPGDGFQRVERAGISAGYFDTVRIPLLAGRDFDAGDVDGAPVVVIINETLANFAWPGESPIGKHFGLGSLTEPIDAEVVGLARDSKIRSASEPARMLVYTSWPQFGGDPALLVRATNAAAITTVRDRIRALDPVLPPAFIVPYPELVGISMLPGRLAAVLVGAFGLVGILLAAIGLYGLLAFSVAQQSREIGVRLALGAEPRQVRRMVVMRGLRLTGAGLLVGLFGAAGVAQLLNSLLFGISPFDPATYLTIAGILMAVATVACWLPARRAAATDPVVALRAE
ncbi:MAG: ABC transporter permease [Acidobacteria bacterium]|nr:ABC transporter permease [Acidobacteriota bacterium]